MGAMDGPGSMVRGQARISAGGSVISENILVIRDPGGYPGSGTEIYPTYGDISTSGIHRRRYIPAVLTATKNT